MKKFTSGLLAGVLVASAVPVIASNGRMIQVFDNVKRVVVDKVEKPFDKNTAPFAYNGTTYVPLRFVADAWGEDVNWDGKTGTVFIGETNNKNAHYWWKNLKHMNEQGLGEFSYSYWYNEKGKSITSNIGDIYSNFLTLGINCYEGKSTTAYSLMEFPLNGQYKQLITKVGLTDDYLNSSAIIDVNIYLDENKVETLTFKNGDMPKDLSINISGYNKIGFEVIENIQNTSSNNIRVGFFDSEFIKK